MLQLIKIRNVLRLKNSLNLFNQINHQSNLARATQLNNQFNTLPISQLNNDSNNNQLTNQLFKPESVLYSNEKQIEDTKSPKTKKTLNKSDKIDRARNLVFKSGSLNPDYDPNNKLPSREKLEEFYQYVEQMFPKFFVEKINLFYFDQYVLIEDNQSGVSKKTIGFDELVKKVSFIRIYYSSMHSQNRMDVLSIAKIPDEGLIKIRWRIVSKGKLLVFIKFWKFWQLRKKEHWNDGIVYFYLNKAGKVHKIVIEKIDKNKEEKFDPSLEKLVKI